VNREGEMTGIEIAEFITDCSIDRKDDEVKLKNEEESNKIYIIRIILI